jgi:uncharacterized membrane protein
MRVFEPFCHQMLSRSPHLWGVQLAVGHRVYGLLMGLPLGAVAFAALVRHDPALRWWAPQIFAVSALPMVVGWALGWFGLWPNTPLSRMLTGGLFGVAAGYWLTRAILGSRAPSCRRSDSWQTAQPF